jgi:hypothetical protein
MKRFPNREELVAAYWQKLTNTIESGGVQPQAKTQVMNGRLRSRSQLGVRQRPLALRHRKHLREIRGPTGQYARLHSHS